MMQYNDTPRLFWRIFVLSERNLTVGFFRFGVYGTYTWHRAGFRIFWRFKSRRSIRADILDHVIPINREHLLRVMKEYVEYYHHDRIHNGLAKDCPIARPSQQIRTGRRIIARPRLGGLHHRYEWSQAA